MRYNAYYTREDIYPFVFNVYATWDDIEILNVEDMMVV